MNRLATLFLSLLSLGALGQCDDCLEDFDLDCICDDVDPCVGIFDILGICNGGCFANQDGDSICDYIDLCIDLFACNYDDPANLECVNPDDCGYCPPQNLFCPFTHGSFHDMNLILAPGCVFGDGLLGLTGLTLTPYGGVLGVQDGIATSTSIGSWTFDECECISTIASGQSDLYVGATLNVPSINGNCGVYAIQLMADANGNVFAETGCCQLIGSGNECSGSFDECGICDGPGAIYECGCENIPSGACDCNGNYLDATGECGGSCDSDFNANGICDDIEVYGCAYELANNFNPEVTTDDGSCEFPCIGDINQNVFDWDADNAVTIADFLAVLSVFGDVDSDSDGIWDSQDDCVDLEACNYSASPTEPCAFIDVLGECGGGCEGDGDGDGICDDEDDCVGVVDECGVCNGPGPTEVGIEDIVITYDSIFLPIDDEWFVYAVEVDTTFGFTCAPFFGDCGDPVSYQGYDYATVLIGEQCWFAENLQSENYENGDAIPSGLGDSEWVSTSSGAVAVYGEGNSECYGYSPDGDACDEAWSLSAYGRLYNWYAVDDARGLCPSGWHVSTDGEWTVLTDHLGGESVAGGQMKASYGWNDGGNGTNSSGFSGLPGGFRDYVGYFFGAGALGYWWSSSSYGWSRDLDIGVDDVTRSYGNPQSGFSVRCVRDAE